MRQTIFFPFAITARLARGGVLRLAVESPSYDTAEYGTVPLLDAAATIDDDSGAVAVFLVHRGLDSPMTAYIDIGSLGPVRRTKPPRSPTTTRPPPTPSNTNSASPPPQTDQPASRTAC